MRRKTNRAEKRAHNRPLPTVDSFRDDPLYPRIEGAVAAILETGKVVAPVDVLVRMDLLSPARLEDWRRGRVAYLERVQQGKNPHQGSCSAGRLEHRASRVAVDGARRWSLVWGEWEVNGRAKEGA
jgi:hypothetical protein